MARAPKVQAAETLPLDWDKLDNAAAPREARAVLGHAEAREQIAAAFSSALPQALLLEGPRGIGKATLAFALAKALLAERVVDAALSGDPEAQADRLVVQGAHRGLLHLQRPYDTKAKPARFRTAISVEEVRRLVPFLGGTSLDGGWRVVIVDPVDDLNINAANAILKLLEEPPRRTLFLLTAHVLGFVMPTIRSRCRSIRLRPLADSAVGEVLSGQGAEPDFAADAGGAPRQGFVLASAGREVVDTARQLLQRGRLSDGTQHHVLGDLAAARKAGQFEVVMDLILGAIAARAKARPAGGRFAELYIDTARQRRTVDEYNLDRKEFVLATCAALAAADANVRG
ncbi:MAG: DNA polymerase III subunit delta' [Pseudomonadota bacterium]